MLGPKGEVHSGVLALLADGSLVATVVSGLPARVLCTTAELSLTFLGEPPSGGGEITARGQLLHLDRQMALAEVYVRDARDRLAAHGTSRCSVFPPIEESIQWFPPDEPLAAETEPGSPDPYLRETPVTDRGTPQGGSRGPRAAPGSASRRVSSTAHRSAHGHPARGRRTGSRVFALLASPWLRNEWGTVYGGMLTLLAKSAAAAAVQATASRGTSFSALDVKINFLHAVPADGRELLATGTVLHRGKRLGDLHSRSDARRCPGRGPDRDDRADAVREPDVKRPATSHSRRALLCESAPSPHRQVCPQPLSGTNRRAG